MISGAAILQRSISFFFYFPPQLALPHRTIPVCLIFCDAGEPQGASLRSLPCSASHFLQLCLESYLRAYSRWEFSQWPLRWRDDVGKVIPAERLSGSASLGVGWMAKDTSGHREPAPQAGPA